RHLEPAHPPVEEEALVVGIAPLGVERGVVVCRRRHQPTSSTSLVKRRNFSGETRIAAPVGHARTQAGPPSIPEHMSHLIASLASSPCALALRQAELASPGPGPAPNRIQLRSEGLRDGFASIRITP